MNFLNLSPLGLMIGLAAIAAGLYLLQRLRVRYRDHPVVTTMFWAAAVQEAPVRVFQQRFRHWLAYLLSLLLCWLLWLGFAGPVSDVQGTAGFNILVIDGSAHAAAGNRFDESKELLLSDISQYPSDSREVYLSGAHNVKLLLAGEERSVLERRLAGLEPAASPSILPELLRQLTLNTAYPDQIQVVVYGDAPVTQETLDSLPAGLHLSRNSPQDSEISNRGVAALGIGEAISGHWDKVDVLFRFVNSTGESVSSDQFRIQIDDEEIGSDRLESLGSNDFRIRDVVADGSWLKVTLTEQDDLNLDNQATLALPTKQRIKVTIGSNVPEPVLNAVNSDSGVEVVDNAADVAIIGPGDAMVDLPSFHLVESNEQNTAFQVGYVGDADAEDALVRSVTALGLGQIDAVALATEMDREIGVALEVGDQRYVSVWADIVGNQFNFSDTLSFPVFVSKALRYLADEEPWYAYLAAGRPAYEQTAGESFGDTDLLSDYALGTYYTRNTAGGFQTADGNELFVALLDDTLGRPSMATPAAGVSPEVTFTDALWGLATWLMLVALLLVGVDWYFYQRGLMP